MAKEKETRRSLFACTACGFETAKWTGKCPGCGAWNTMEEATRFIAPAAAGKAAPKQRPGACGHELSTEFGLTHGASMAMSFAAMSRYVYKADTARYARYARNVWGVSEGDEEQQALEGIMRTIEFFRSLELPVCAEDLLNRPFTQQEIEDMTERCSQGGKKILGNVAPLNREDVRKIYQLMSEKI